MKTKKLHEITQELCAKHPHLKKLDVCNVVEDFIANIIHELAEGGDVLIKDFGKFEVKQFESRTVRNAFGEGKDYSLPSRKRVNFKDSKYLKDALDRKQEVPPYIG